MFDLEQEIAKWRSELTSAGFKTPEIIRELEQHLRDDIAQQIHMHLAEAFKTARQHIGEPAHLKSEFDVIGQPGLHGKVRRHGWKILFCSGLGLLVAIALHLTRPRPYQSEVKLLVRYVPANYAYSNQPIPTAAAENEREWIMSREVGILNSLDLDRQVVEKIGAEKILLKAGGGKELNRAIAEVRSGLTVEVPGKGTMVRITFRGSNPDVIHQVLSALVEQYLNLHAEVQRSARRGTDPLVVDPVRVSNIIMFQRPSPPLIPSSSYRQFTAVVFAGVMAGLVWVFGVGLYDLFSRTNLRRIG